MEIGNLTSGEQLTPQRELEICQTMMDLSHDVAFEWDLDTDIITLSSKWETRFGHPSICEQFGAHMQELPYFHEDDIATLMDALDHMTHGESFGEVVLRILDSTGRYTWNRIRATAQFRENGTLKKIIGVIADIDSDHQTSEALLAKTEHDALTGLLNKDTARLRIEKYLAGRNTSLHAAMLILDLDNFKAVNDLYGHMFGDTVLTRVASTIRSLFRESDILARIGGDEFLIFLMDIPDQSLAEQRCQRLTNAIQKLFNQQLKDCNFSCSVGIAMVPEHGCTYPMLFQRADRALYTAKDMGKNTFAIFSSETETRRYETQINPRIKSEASLAATWGSVAVYLLEQLYETQNVRTAIQSALNLLGMQLQAEHLFLMDFNNNASLPEWVHPHLVPAGRGFRAADFLVYPQQITPLFNDDGIFYCHDCSQLPDDLQGVVEGYHAKALLLCAIRTQGIDRGCVGMRSASETKLWTQKEIDALVFLSHIVSLFLWNNGET